MHIHNIKLRVEPLSIEGSPPLLQATIEIDGEPVGKNHTLDWHELFRSIRGSGEFFVWTAPSGEPLEAGIEDCCIGTHAGDKINWEWLDPISLNGMTPEQPREQRSATFGAKAYEDALWQGWWTACKLLRQDRRLVVRPHSLGEAGLLGLDRWFKTDGALPFVPSYLSPPAVG